MTIDVKLVGYKKLEQDLGTFAKKAVPYAARNGLNGSAFALQDEWRGEVRRTFTLRNQYTVRSIQVDKAQGLDLRTMQAVTGSVAPFMSDQEEGATVHGKAGKKAIPGPAAAGQAPGGKRTRKVRVGLRLSSITIDQPSTQGYGKRRANAVAIAVAIRKGERFAMLNRRKGGGRGLFEVRGNKRGARVRLLYNMSKRSVRVPAAPTLQRSIKRAQYRFERAHYQALLYQLKRWKVFGY
jgi:hypothetical protein